MNSDRTSYSRRSRGCIFDRKAVNCYSIEKRIFAEDRVMGLKQLPGVTRVTLNEKVYRTLMESITDGTLRPGEELKEQHIAKQLSVSPTPVREALKRLSSDGLVELIPYRGAVVKELDYHEIREAYACREALELLAVREAVPKMNTEKAEELYRVLDELEGEADPQKAADISRRFDSIIYALAGNKVLVNLLESLKGVIERDRKFSSSDKGRREEILKEHKAIVDAMASGDLSAAEKAVTRHIRNGLQYIEQKAFPLEFNEEA